MTNTEKIAAHESVTCIECGTIFYPKNRCGTWPKYCSRKCARRDWVKKNLDKKRKAYCKWRKINGEKAREATRRWRVANYEKAKEMDRKRYNMNREKIQKWRETNRTHIRKIYHRWRDANLEKAREWNRDWRRANPTKAREMIHNWREAHPEAVREMSRNESRKRRAHLRGAESENISLEYIHKRDGGRCQLCGKKVNMKLKHPDPMSPSLDHIVPLAKGGSNLRTNVQLTHWICNVQKGTRAFGEQLLAIG